MDFEDLNDDVQIKEKITQVHDSVDKIKQILNVAYKSNVQEQLCTMDKVNYDLFLSYTLNTLYWIYLRTKGIDPNKSDIKNELNRVRDYMIKAKQTHDRITIRPRVDKQASKRFVKHGLGIPREAKEPPNKKTKFK